MNSSTTNDGRLSADRKKLGTLWLLDNEFEFLTGAMAVAISIIFVMIVGALLYGAWPALRHFGAAFFVTEAWNPVTENFGALGPILGTVITSALAMLIAFPTGIGIAVFLTELCPKFLRKTIGIGVELLAGIPSIIYGIWGLFYFAPFFQRTAEPWLIGAFGHVPLLRTLFSGPPYGIGILTASLILSIMILPFITAITRDIFETVPSELKESAYGLGATKWENVTNVMLPYSRAGVVGGAMLALGRALGETMAVTFVIGNAHRIGTSLLAPGTTISATMANEFTEAVGDLYLSSLIELGLILFLITTLVLAIAYFMLRALENRAGIVT